MRSMMRTRAFSSSSDEEENKERPRIAPRGTLGAEARRLTAENSSSSDENDKQSASAVSSCSQLPKQNLALIVSERDELKEQCAQLMQALETALAESEDLKRLLHAQYVLNAVFCVKIDAPSSRESYVARTVVKNLSACPSKVCVGEPVEHSREHGNMTGMIAMVEEDLRRTEQDCEQDDVLELDPDTQFGLRSRKTYSASPSSPVHSSTQDLPGARNGSRTQSHEIAYAEAGSGIVSEAANRLLEGKSEGVSHSSIVQGHANMCLNSGWMEVLDETSGKIFYCPVNVTTKEGGSVWELPPDGIIFSGASAQQVRESQQDAENAAVYARAAERAHKLFTGIFICIILLQVVMAGAFLAYMEVYYGMATKMVSGSSMEALKRSL